MRIVREISSGGIVFRIRNRTAEVVLIRVHNRWCLPKGQLEEGEGLEETALREVREETGIEGEVLAKLGDITYWHTNRTREGETVRIFKRVYFYLMRYIRGDVSQHDDEVEEACWMPVNEALKKLSYPTERETMRKAMIFAEAERVRKPEPLDRRVSRG